MLSAQKAFPSGNFVRPNSFENFEFAELVSFCAPQRGGYGEKISTENSGGDLSGSLGSRSENRVESVISSCVRSISALTPLTPYEQIEQKFNYKAYLEPELVQEIDEFLLTSGANNDSEALYQLQSGKEDEVNNACATLRSRGWVFLQDGDSEVRVLFSPRLPQWVFKCSSLWKKNIKRCPMAEILQHHLKESQCDLIQIPQKALIPIQKISLLSREKTIEALMNDAQLEQRFADQICDLVVAAGFGDPHFDNVCFTTEGKFAIIDTDSLGEKAAAKAGLRIIMNNAEKKLPYLFKTAEAKLNSL
jgi:hypothetical protein